MTIKHQNMRISLAWLIAEVQAHIEPPLILMIKKDPTEANEYDIIKIKMRQNPSDARWYCGTVGWASHVATL